MRGRDVPVLSITGDGGFMFTANELATAVRHRIPLVTVVFNDGAFGNVRPHPGGTVRQPADRQRSRQSRISSNSPKASAPPRERARHRRELRAALRRGFARRDGPTLIEVPVGPMPSPWEFIFMPRVRG